MMTSYEWVGSDTNVNKYHFPVTQTTFSGLQFVFQVCRTEGLKLRN